MWLDLGCAKGELGEEATVCEGLRSRVATKEASRCRWTPEESLEHAKRRAQGCQRQRLPVILRGCFCCGALMREEALGDSRGGRWGLT